jgi:hypothetical protein
MLSNTRKNLRSFWKKNGQDIHAILSGELSRLLKASNGKNPNREVPVFVFHSIESATLEKQLRFLAENGYISVNSEDLVRIIKGELEPHSRTVALTFDDSTGSFWASAFPLLKKYRFQCILFVIAGLVPDDNRDYPNLEDVWQGKATMADIKSRELIQPLCTWSELQKIHRSGIVDIQSHSLTHSRINVSPEIVDFISPKFDTYFFENINVPVAVNDSVETPRKVIRLGQPVYDSASRLSGRHRFLEDPMVAEKLVNYVEENGGKAFFSRPFWRRDLKEIYRKTVKDLRVKIAYETPRETGQAIRLELEKSKSRLFNNSVLTRG